MQTAFWRLVAISDTRRTFCFILAVFAIILAILANVDHQFVLVSEYGASAKLSHILTFLAVLCIANVVAYYRR